LTTVVNHGNESAKVPSKSKRASLYGIDGRAC
jgi:hypothetical protein